MTAPMPEILSEIAPVVTQESVALWPAVILAGDAEKEEIVGGTGAVYCWR